MIDHLRDAALWYGVFLVGVVVGICVCAFFAGASMKDREDG